MPTYAKTPLEIAAEVHAFDPARLGDTHMLKFSVINVPLATVSTSVWDTITVPVPSLLLALSASPNDGAAASYAGMELEFTYGDRSFCTNGKASQFVSFASLAGRGPGPSQVGGPWYAWEVPIFLARGISIAARVRNNTAGTLTPTIVCKTVEIRGAAK